MTAKGFFGLFVDAGNAWMADRAPSAGAALAWYAVFSVAPLLLIVITITGQAVGESAAREYLDAQVGELVGEEGAKAVSAMLDAARKPGTGIVASVTGWAMLVFGCIGLLMELQDSLNAIWRVQPSPDRSWQRMIRSRLLTFSVVLTVAFLLLVSLFVSTALTTLARFGEPILGKGLFGDAVHAIVSFGVVTVLFAVIFRMVPDAKIAWSDVWLGAAVTALLFTVGKAGIAWYIGRAAVGSAFGAAGSLAVLLVWLYYSAQIFLYGAEFTRVYADKYGSRIVARGRSSPAAMPGVVAPAG